MKQEKSFIITAAHQDGVPFMTFRDTKEQAAELAATFQGGGVWLAVTVKDSYGNIISDWGVPIASGDGWTVANV